MVQRRMIDGVVDGIVYSGWIGLGFSLVENIGYFVLASRSDLLVETLFLRGLLTSFAHPLFTVCVGWAVGRAIARGSGVAKAALGGWLIAGTVHGVWNLSLISVAGSEATYAHTLIAAVLIVTVLTVMVRVILQALKQERRVYLRNARSVIEEFEIGLTAVPLPTTWKSLRAIRRSMSRDQRHEYDRRRALPARIVALSSRPGPRAEAHLAELLSALRHRVSHEPHGARGAHEESAEC